MISKGNHPQLAEHFRLVKYHNLYTQFNGLLTGGLEHEFYFSIYWEFHHPN